MLRSDEKKREPDHCVQKIRVAHAKQRKTAKYIDQCAAQVWRRRPVPHLAAVPVKADPCKIQAQQDHSVMKKEHMLLRHEDSRQTKRISDHIVLQGRKQVRPVSHMQVEGGKGRFPLQDTP